MHDIVVKYLKITENGKTHETINVEDVTKYIEKINEENKKLKQELQQIQSKKRESGYLNAKEAAEYIGLSVQTIYNMKSNGSFLFERDYSLTKTGRPRFKLEALDAWLAGKRTKILRAVV